MTVEEIAAGLSEAQKRALLAMPTGRYVLASEIGAKGATMRALWDHWPGGFEKGNLVSLVHRDVCDSPLSYLWKISREGLALRQYLEQQP